MWTEGLYDNSMRIAVELIDDAVYTDDTSTHTTGTSKGLGVMAVAVPTDASVNTNDIGMLAMSAARALQERCTFSRTPSLLQPP